MNEVVKDMIDAIVSDDQIGAEEKFKSALSAKVGQALDDKRKDLAGTILSKEIKTKDDNAEESIEIDNWKRRT